MTNEHVWNWMNRNYSEIFKEFIDFENDLVIDNTKLTETKLNEFLDKLPAENVGLDNSKLKKFL